MDMVQKSGLPFMKMHGLGNDFVVVDARERPAKLSDALITALGDRHRGVGFDQLVVVSMAGNTKLTFYNADGSTAGACGNATRCIADWLMPRHSGGPFVLETERGMLEARRDDAGLISVNMGAPLLSWQEIPLAEDVDILALPIAGAPTATGMGNPHCTFFLEDLDTADLEAIGPQTEHHPLFPARTNVQLAQLIGPDHLRVRVWERGVGVTLASGSSSCAVAVAAHRRGLTGRAVTIELDGGTLQIDWRDDGVWMTGPTMHVFDGVLTADFLASIQQ